MLSGDPQVDEAGHGAEDEHVDGKPSKHVTGGSTDEQVVSSKHTPVSHHLPALVDTLRRSATCVNLFYYHTTHSCLFVLLMLIVTVVTWLLQ